MFPTVAGVPILPEEVALSAVALVGAVDVCTLLAARAGRALVHIWRVEVRAHYCRSLIKEFPPLHVNKMMLFNQLCFVLPGKSRTESNNNKPTLICYTPASFDILLLGESVLFTHARV